jgi:predicted hotdog family 3-hydroxylacyl-ACP dehydratase
MAERALPDRLIPHRGAARLVEAIVDVDPEAGLVVCRGRVRAGSAFASGGRAPAVVAVELAAQAAAVQHALGGAGDGPPRPGYLVAVRSASFHTDEVPVDVPLLATVRRTGQAGPLATYDVQVTGADGEPILGATLSTHAGG